MKNLVRIIFIVALGARCSVDKTNSSPPNPPHLINDIPAYKKQMKVVLAVIEISAGSNEKWEVNKQTGQLDRDTENGKPRTIHYLGYPANYGFIPQTLLSEESGGDGDPLDVVVLGDVLKQGTQVPCVPLGGIQLIDHGENDFKVILAPEESEFAAYKDIDALQKAYPGMIEAIEDWFLHYKGPGKMESKGIVDRKTSEATIMSAHQEHRKKSSLKNKTNF